MQSGHVWLLSSSVQHHGHAVTQTYMHALVMMTMAMQCVRALDRSKKKADASSSETVLAHA
jgi:hypothetical protein